MCVSRATGAVSVWRSVMGEPTGPTAIPPAGVIGPTPRTVITSQASATARPASLEKRARR